MQSWRRMKKNVKRNLPRSTEIEYVSLFILATNSILKSMTHSPEIGAKTWRWNSALTSRLVPDSGADRLRVLFRVDFCTGIHVTTTATGDIDWSMSLFSFCLHSLGILLFVVIFASSMLVFGANFSSCQIASGTKNRRRFLECVSWALFLVSLLFHGCRAAAREVVRDCSLMDWSAARIDGVTVTRQDRHDSGYTDVRWHFQRKKLT